MCDIQGLVSPWLDVRYGITEARLAAATAAVEDLLLESVSNQDWPGDPIACCRDELTPCMLSGSYTLLGVYWDHSGMWYMDLI